MRKCPDIHISVRGHDMAHKGTNRLLQTRHNYEISYPYEWSESDFSLGDSDVI
jgi:hypothetical protein